MPGRRRGQSHNAARKRVDYLVVPTNGEEVWRGFSYHANCESGTECSAADAAKLSAYNSSVTNDPAWNEGDSTDADNTMTIAAPMPTPSTPIALPEASSCRYLHSPENRDDAYGSRGHLHRSSTSCHVRGAKARDCRCETSASCELRACCTW